MAIPLTPLAALALRYGTAMAIGYAAARAIPRGRFPRAVERQMDHAPRGLRLRKARGQITGSGRFTHITRLGRIGPRFQIDGTALARLKVRRLT